ELHATSDDNTIDSAIYTLSDPDKMDEVLKESEKLIDTDTFSLQSNDSMYQSMLEPLNNVASFSKNVVLLVAVAGII
ncbi:ABC transporter permease, partial [Enterococcus faecium]